MPPRRNNLRQLPRRRAVVNSGPPPTMTWGKATPVLAVSVIFDAVGLFFHQFWFFGPALVGVYCTAKGTEVVGSLGGATAAVCAAGATAAGYVFSVPLTTFGVIMAIAVGLFGWLTIGLWLMVSNSRIFKENGLWFAGSLLIDGTPLIGALPALSVIVWRMYHVQIKKEKAALKKYNEEQAAAQLQRRQEQIAEALSARREQEMQAAETEELREAERVENEIPEKTLKAA